MLKKLMLCITIAALLCPRVFAVNAVVTDVSGQNYNVLSIKLAKGSNLNVVCGETRMDVPFKSVSVMKIAPDRISSIDRQLYFAVEIRTGDGAVIGGLDGGGRCSVHAGNSLVGKLASKAKFSSPLGNVSAVSVVGKGDEKKSGEGDEEDESEE
jgi:hypothetical protein